MSAPERYPHGPRRLVVVRRGQRVHVMVSARESRAVELPTLDLLPPGSRLSDTTLAKIEAAATGPQRLELDDGGVVLAVTADVGHGVRRPFAIYHPAHSRQIVTAETLDDQRRTERLCQALAAAGRALRLRRASRHRVDEDSGGRQLGDGPSTRPRRRDEQQLGG